MRLMPLRVHRGGCLAQHHALLRVKLHHPIPDLILQHWLRHLQLCLTGLSLDSSFARDSSFADMSPRLNTIMSRASAALAASGIIRNATHSILSRGLLGALSREWLEV